MILLLATPEARKQAEEEQRLALLLRRQMALYKDTLMQHANELVEEHFRQVARGNCLKASQLNNLEGVAFSADNPGKVIQFINKQAQKDIDKKPERQGWTHNKLHEKLEGKISIITGQQRGRKTEVNGLKDTIITAVQQRAESAPAVSESVLGQWLSKEREQDIQMELLREFMAYFVTFYILKAKEVPGHTEEDD